MSRGLKEKLLQSRFERQQGEWSYCRALILQAVNKQPGMMYKEIRKWIENEKDVLIENVGARCRELARELNPPLATITYDERGNAHVYPIDYNKCMECQKP